MKYHDRRSLIDTNAPFPRPSVYAGAKKLRKLQRHDDVPIEVSHRSANDRFMGDTMKRNFCFEEFFYSVLPYDRPFIRIM